MSGRDNNESDWKLAGEAILRSYGIIYFSQSHWFGAVVLLCTLIAYPIQGLIGLAGLSICLFAAIQLKLDRQMVRSGIYQFNTLLISLTIGYFYRLEMIDTVTLLVLLPCATLFTLLTTVSLSDIMYRSLGIPAISLPFVIAQTLLIFIVAPVASSASPLASTPIAPLSGSPDWELGAIPLAQHLLTIVKTMSAILLMPNYYLGGIIIIAMLILSRLYVFYALLGFAVSMTVLTLLPVSITYEQASMLAFNFAFCSLAIGGVFFIPSRRSLVLAIFSTAICTLIAVVVVKLFESSGFIPIALPVNFVVLLVLHAMRMRMQPGLLNLTPFMPTTPEENFRKFSLMRMRFPEFGYPIIRCPFSGERAVTQGVDGDITHKNDWKYAFDFEVLDRSGEPRLGTGEELTDYYSYGTPVLAPANGTVIKVVDEVKDGEPGSLNLIDNWGNFVLIGMDNGYYLMVCHLQRHSIRCYEGSRIRQGEVIGSCGNSGRSPIPHIHLQVQSGPTVVAKTVQFYLSHYYEKQGCKLTYHSSGIPSEGTIISAAAVNNRVADCFTSIRDRKYRFRLIQAGKATEETINTTTDTLGNLVFESDLGGSIKATLQAMYFRSMIFMLMKVFCTGCL
ncbi:MAG: urea transporter [Planctomycetaceae bacterium]